MSSAAPQLPGEAPESFRNFEQRMYSEYQHFFDLEDSCYD